jgi:hypothetical protein
VLVQDGLTNKTTPISYHSNFIGCFYEPLLCRSFLKQSSLYVDGSQCFVNQQPSLRRIAREHDDISQCQAAREYVNNSGLDLWSAVEAAEDL